MAKCLVLYHAPVSAGDQIANATPEQTQSGMDSWMAWAQRAGDAIVDLGAPLGDRRTVGGEAGSGDAVGFSILQADSGSAVAGLLEGHPHLHLPGGSIEALEFLPLPGM
jgi:hypothetical protein